MALRRRAPPIHRLPCLTPRRVSTRRRALKVTPLKPLQARESSIVKVSELGVKFSLDLRQNSVGASGSLNASPTAQGGTSGQIQLPNPQGNLGSYMPSNKIKGGLVGLNLPNPSG